MLFVAIPILNESAQLPELIRCIKAQTYHDFTVYFCVNQPAEWWVEKERTVVCIDNRRSLQLLNGITGFSRVVFDRSSEKNGWQGKQHGVGWARKTLMDAISQVAGAKDIILSLDADTTFGPRYFASVVDNFQQHPLTVGIAVPYFHLLPEDHEACRAILRYELYMRYYAINCWRIGSPYNFTALGSAMACRVSTYRSIGGMTPKMSGEDFYFLQKLRKFGTLMTSNSEKVYPAARFSDRVYFGTGPAMIRGNGGDWSGYPIYRHQYFNEIRQFYELLPEMFEKTIATEVTAFLQLHLQEDDPFESIRRNCTSRDQFIRACHEKFDGLRMLQFLKRKQNEDPGDDAQNLIDFFNCFYPTDLNSILPEASISGFEVMTIQDLDKIRMKLVKIEEDYQASS
ncbi:MAG: glycosyltransferase [Bacteroidota bacterium]